MDAATSNLGYDGSHHTSGSTDPSHPSPNPSRLNVIALISGGKDSLYSILHCLINGHTITALANLHPRVPANGAESEEDINSYMYQTVGHTVIPLYEEALGIPLYRQEILGAAVNTDRDYAAPQDADDETESLVPLLLKVKAAHPQANAISTGAILSTYQRTRVESVALRLGLTPLSYLWQYPLLPPYSQSALLSDMAAVGQDARIIKVASGGLDETFLWENVANPRTITRLKKAMSRFGENGDGAVLGEGGEFETLAIDGPSALWKKRIEITADGVEFGEGGNAIFKGKEQRTVGKNDGDIPGLEAVRIADLWDDEFKPLLDTLSTLPQPQYSEQTPSPQPSSTQNDIPQNTIHSTPSTLTISNLTADPSLYPDPTSQLTAILSTLSNHLRAHNLTPTSISHVTLLLRSISSFTLLNPIYSSLFPSPNPPSRVTIACGSTMPKAIHVQLSAIIPRTPIRRGLHVQSRSYWAPANIGPYSQAISSPLALSNPDPDADVDIEAPEIVYVAGQIPLVPASMDVFVELGFKGQTMLALQHLWRIGRAVSVKWWVGGVAYISGCGEVEARERVRIAREAWRGICEFSLGKEDGEEEEEEDDYIDPWDAKNRVRGFGGGEGEDGTVRARIPDRGALVGDKVGDLEEIRPFCFVVQVEELPRGVDVEWHSAGVAKGRVAVPCPGTVEVGGTGTRFFGLEVGGDGDGDGIPGMTKRGVVEELEGVEGVQWVPCRRVWGEGGAEVAAVLVGSVSL
ncbi:ATP binding L-PSP endoribonuclease family protein-like protein [Dendryphion nanum]|uniref:Diphthine--ammonia ligase n=1 Tax=Dendryphion nanum TaxID=256645 RepID=A0A9P9E7K0_9PLEO|nr:ATP binding L-PSP endoribonuclease family protein-like protein [Dendryphion nanum]